MTWPQPGDLGRILVNRPGPRAYWVRRVYDADFKLLGRDAFVQENTWVIYAGITTDNVHLWYVPTGEYVSLIPGEQVTEAP